MALRVLHCPANVGNHPQSLARAERRLGLDSWCVEIEGTWIGYGVDELLAPPGTSLAVAEARRWRLLPRLLRDFDVVHFNFGRSLFPLVAPTADGGIANALGRVYRGLVGMRELRLLRRTGAAIAVTFQGDDARQGHGPAVPDRHRRLAEGLPGYYTERGDELKRRTIELFDRCADRIFFLNPDLGDFLPARAQFVPYAHVDPREWTPARDPRLADVPRIVHAPTHRGIKGTRQIVDAVDRLRKEGLQVELQLVERLPHDQARAVYASADLLVDQLLLGWYGGLAVEFMALGKPVVCFVDEPTAKRRVPPELIRDLPIVRATREDLVNVLRAMVTHRRAEYLELSGRSRAFVEAWHDPLTIAARMRAEYEAALSERHATPGLRVSGRP